MKRIIGKLDPRDRNVTIWGAGFSGLILGYYLKEQGYRVTIYEKSNRVGGKIHTQKLGLGLVELGANALYMNADTMDLLKELELEPLPATRKLRRLLLINGKPRKPLSLSLLTKSSLKAGARPPLVSDGLTVEEFFKPLIGSDNVHNILSPALGGIYGTSADQLHFKSIFHEVSHIAQFESYWHFMRTLMKNQKKKPRLEVSGSVSFEGGMQTLIDRLAEKLKNEIKLNYSEKFRIRGNTILCTDAHNAALLTQSVRPNVSSELERIKYQALCTSTVFMKREIKSLHRAFGILIPQNSGMRSIGVINNKAIFPANNPNIYSYTFISRQEASEDDLRHDIKALSPDFSPEDIVGIDTTFWDEALPIYNLQRYLSIKKLHQVMRNETHFALFGNYVAGISLREMVSAARKFTNNPDEETELI